MTDTPVTDTSLEALRREIAEQVCCCEASSCDLRDGAEAAIDILHLSGRIRLGGDRGE